MMGIMTIQRLSDKEKYKWKIDLSEVDSSFIGYGVLSVILGFALPKHTPIWPDPIPYIQVQIGKSASGALGSKVGYGIDDSRLGGPIARDNTVVFRTEVESSHYWKVEAKMYTQVKVGFILMTRHEFHLHKTVMCQLLLLLSGNTIEKTVGTSKVYQVKEYPPCVISFWCKTIQSGIGYSYEIDPSIRKNLFIMKGQSLLRWTAIL